MASSKKAAPRRPSSKTASRAEGSTAADLVDQQLARYRSMRDFSLTEEPSGAGRHQRSSPGLPFCIQKHAASHLHYDLRLGWNGVLKSWAVAKGPSYYPGDKRLAVQVEDHPIEYGGFEGVIPKGQYGGGTVMLWDQGTWEPQPAYPDVDAGLRDGSLKFLLHGAKLKGKWALIRMKGRAANESKPNWLLIKEHDDLERREHDASITETEPRSVVTGRTIDEIARNEDHVWNSSQTSSAAKAWKRQDKPALDPIDLSTVASLPKEQQPRFVEPELATLAEVPPSDNGWLHELKLDGYRMQARKSGDKVQLLTRTGLDWTARMRSIASAIARLPATHATLDGELVVVAANGTTSFADLQASMQEGAAQPLSYFAFDLLHLNGHSTRELPLKDRKQLLAELLKPLDSDTIRLSEHLETGGERLLREACKLRAEGIVSKRADSLYRSDRSSDWLKTKCLHEQELVIGGYTLPTNGIHGVGALLLGYYSDTRLLYAGRTGTGFTQKTHRLLRDRLEKLHVTPCPFTHVPAEAARGVRWVSPQIVAQVRFANWTADGLVRQAAFLGLREDKSPGEVVREEAAASPRSSRGKTSVRASPSPSKPRNTPGVLMETAPGRLTHPDKILDPASGMTKRMLADYYWAVAGPLLASIIDRPVSLVRCPDGIGKSSFFQKHRNDTLPDLVDSVDVPDKKTGVVEPYITIATPEALAALAQIGVLELHPWGSRNQDLEHPDRLIFDLDPDESLPWSDVVRAATEVRALLKSSSLESFVKTTGGKGLHVVAPLTPSITWAELKEFAHDLVLSLEQRHPARYLTKMSKAARAGRIFLDYLRNERGATAVAAYSPRARPGAPVSMPLTWKELEATTERPVYRVVDLASWSSRLLHDPWKRIATVNQSVKTKKG